MQKDKDNDKQWKKKQNTKLGKANIKHRQESSVYEVAPILS